MVQKIKNRKKGMTLVEILISVAILGLLGLLVSSLIINSVRRYTMGKMRQELRQKTHLLITRMQQDIKKAYEIPTRGSGLWIPSAILLPNPYGNTGAFGDVGNGRSENRLVISVQPGELHEQDVVNPELIYVEYIVPARKVAYRRTYDITPAIDGYNGFTTGSGVWLIDDTYFTTDNVTKSVVLVQLDGKNDYINFTVQRPRLEEDDASLGIEYDRYLVSLVVEMVRYYKDNEDHPVKYSEKTDVMVGAKGI